jgi:pilus assembly protein CpaF
MSNDMLERVRQRLAVGGAPPTPARVADAVRSEAGGVVGHTDLLAALRSLGDEFAGAGALEPLLRDPDTTDVLVTGPTQVWLDGGSGLHRTDIRFPSEDAVRRLAQRLALAAGRRLDDAQPFVDAWLPGAGPHGRVRLHAILPPLAPDGTCLSLRVLRPATHNLAALRTLGTFDTRTAALLAAIVKARLAFLVVGGTGTGKTTLLAALLGSVPTTERIICVEDAAEWATHPCHMPLYQGKRVRRGVLQDRLRDRSRSRGRRVFKIEPAVCVAVGVVTRDSGSWPGETQMIECGIAR